MQPELLFWVGKMGNLASRSQHSGGPRKGEQAGSEA